MNRNSVFLTLASVMFLFQFQTLKIYSQEPDFFEKNRFTINEIKFIGLDDSNREAKDERWRLYQNDFLSQVRQHKDKLKFFEGEKFTVLHFEVAAEILKNWLHDKGFTSAKVSSKCEKMSDKNVRLIFLVERGEKVVVSEINIVGNKNVSTSEILTTLKNALGESWENWDERKYYYYSQRNVRELLSSKGYLRTVVSFSFQKKDDEVKVLLEINEGSRYRIGGIKIEGLKFISEGNFLEIFEQKQGEIADGKQLGEFLYTDLASYYKNRGYLLYDAELEPEFIAPTNKDLDGIVNLKIQIDEGKQFTIGDIKILGSQKDISKVFKLLGVKKGEVFNQEALENGIKRINETNEFAFVDKDKDVDLLNDNESNMLQIVIKINGKTIYK